MTWVRLDDEFDGNPKVLRVGLAGAGLYARALSYCGRHLTDGYVPDAWVAGAIAGERRDLPRRLEAAGLWRRADADDGWEIPDFKDFNPSAESVKRDRAAGRERAQRSRDRAALRRLGCRCFDPLDHDRRSPDCPMSDYHREQAEGR